MSDPHPEPLHDITHFEVGEPYNPRMAMPATDQLQYNYRCGQHELVIFLERPSAYEVDDIRKGRAEFALFERDDLLILLCRFGEQDWSEAFYSWHRLSEDERMLPDPGDEGGDKRRLLPIFLVDRATGFLLVLRSVTFSPEFTTALHDAIRRQASRPYPGDTAYEAQVQRLFQRYARTRELVRLARARCLGGAD